MSQGKRRRSPPHISIQRITVRDVRRGQSWAKMTDQGVGCSVVFGGPTRDRVEAAVRAIVPSGHTLWSRGGPGGITYMLGSRPRGLWAAIVKAIG